MKKSTILVAAFLAASLINFTAVAGPALDEKCGPGDRHEHVAGPDGQGGPFMFRHKFNDGFPIEAKLNLSEDQKKVLGDARNAADPARKELERKMRSAHEALLNAGDSNADDATLARLAKDLADLFAQQELSRIKLRQQFVSILTPEQKQKLEAFKAERKDAPHRKDHRKDHREEKPQ